MVAIDPPFSCSSLISLPVADVALPAETSTRMKTRSITGLVTVILLNREWERHEIGRLAGLRRYHVPAHPLDFALALMSPTGCKRGVFTRCGIDTPRRHGCAAPGALVAWAELESESYREVRASVDVASSAVRARRLPRPACACPRSR